jgi:hypothetical protein
MRTLKVGSDYKNTAVGDDFGVFFTVPPVKKRGVVQKMTDTLFRKRCCTVCFWQRSACMDWVNNVPSPVAC